MNITTGSGRAPCWRGAQTSSLRRASSPKRTPPAASRAGSPASRLTPLSKPAGEQPNNAPLDRADSSADRRVIKSGVDRFNRQPVVGEDAHFRGDLHRAAREHLGILLIIGERLRG